MISYFVIEPEKCGGRPPEVLRRHGLHLHTPRAGTRGAH